MNRINILVDCHVFDQSLQGTTTYLKGLYLELIKDTSITFFFVSHHYNLEKEFGTHANVKYLKFTSTNKFYRLLIELPRLIKKNKIDYAHFQYIVPLIKNCKYIVTLHDLLFLDYPKYFPIVYKISKRFLYKWSAKYSDIVLTVSDFSKSRIEHHFNLKNVFLTPNAVDTVFYEEFDKNEIQNYVKQKFNIENYFLFVSRWEPRKNHHFLLKTFVESKFYENYNLVFVGVDAIENKEYDRYFNSLSEEIKVRIIRLKKVDFTDLVSITKGATLSIYPSIAEGFGIPPLESLAAKVPTICSNTTAMSDFDFMENMLFNPFSQKDLENKIKLALHTNDWAEIASKMQKKYNWQKAKDNFISILNSNKAT